MRRTLLLVAVGCAALGLAPVASAKWCIRITTSPARPIVGASVVLRMQTFDPAARDGGRVGPGKPVQIGLPQQMLLLQPPRGDPVGVDLRVRRDDRSIWEARFVFPRAGLWRLRSIDETPLGAGCRGRVLLRVASRP
jgi:hypothetical protein